MTDDAAPDPVRLVPSRPTGSTFLVAVEACLWTVFTIGLIMVMVIVLMT